MLNWSRAVQGGTFLYVATVLQPALAHPQSPSQTGGGEDVGRRKRMLLTIGGMLTPYIIASIFGDDHA